jgi:hypothetical protein
MSAICSVSTPITQNSTDQTVARLRSACTTRRREPNTVHVQRSHHSTCESVLRTAIAQHMNEHNLQEENHFVNETCGKAPALKRKLRLREL